MAKLSSSSSPPAPADTFSIYVDTNLDTHLLISVSSEDTLGDLKGKLKSYHAFCFPSIGDINIQSMKVRRRGYFYHLVDSMHVISAFNGIKGAWFLQVDAILSACDQDRTFQNAVNHDGGQSQKDQLLDSEPNACTLGVRAGQVHDFVMNGPSDENGDANADASGRLNLSSRGLLDGLHMSLAEHEKMTSGNVPGLRQQVEGDMPVESLGDHGTDKVVDKGEGNAREEHHGTSNEVDNDVFSVRKEKLEKSSNVVHNDPLLEKDCSSIERKKHKKKKDGSSEVLIGDPLVEYGSCKLSKETSAAENIYPETYSLEKHDSGISLACDGFSLKARATDEKKRKKREKKKKSESDIFCAGKQVTEENPREAFTMNVTDADKETNSAIFVDKATIPVTDGDTGKVGANTVPLPSDLKGSELVIEATKSSRSKKKSKTLSKSVNAENHQEASENNHKDLNLVSDGINITGGAIYQENPTGGFGAPLDANTRNARRSCRKKSDRTESESESFSLQPHSYDATHSSRGQAIGGIPEENALLGESTVLENPAPENSTVVSNPNGRSSHEKRKRKAKAQPPNIKSINEEPIHPLEKEATRDKPDEISEDKCEEDKAAFIGEVAPPETLADDSIEKVIEGNTEVLLGLNHENSNTKTMQLMTQNEHAESSVAENIYRKTYSLEKHEPGISLACDDFSSKARATDEKKRKRREKKGKNESDFVYARKQVTEENPREAFTKSVTDADKETNSAIFVKKATIPFTDGDTGKVGANTVPLPSDLKGAKSSHCKESKTLFKSVNAENHQEASDNNPKDLNLVSDGINTTGGAIYEENPTGGFCAPFDADTRNTRRSRKKNSDRTKSESSSLQPRGQAIGGIPKENALLGESTVLENPAPENSTVVSNPNGRSSHEKRKRKAKAQPPNIQSINEEPIHPLEKEATRDKPDEILEDKCKEDKADFIGAVAPPETLADDSIEKVIEGNTKVLLGLNHENSNTKTMQLMTQNERAESSVSDDLVEIPKSDTEKVNFIDFFIPKASQLEPHASVEEPPSMATDTEKPLKEKHRRKRKPNMKLENSAYTLVNPSSINEQQTSKTKTQDGDPGSHGLDVPVLHHMVEEPKAKKLHKERSTDIRKTDVQCGDTSSALGEIQHLHDESMLKKKPFHCDETQVQLPVSKDKHSKHHKAKKTSISKSENKRVPYLDENVNINTIDANLAFAKSSPVAVTENPFSSCADVSMKETMAGLVASGVSTEVEAPTQIIKHKVVRKPPSKKSGENLSKTGHQKSLIATSSTIFNGSMSKTSEDEIDKFPGVGSSSHNKDDDGSDGIILTQTSSEVKKSTSSYKKAEATALQSQSQPEDGQSQQVDVVMET